MHLSQVQKIIRKKNDYIEVAFDTLLEKQQHSRRGATKVQLEEEGVGYVCLKNIVQYDSEIKRTLETSLKKSNMKLFRTEHSNSEDASRLQLVTTYGNALDELTLINQKQQIHTKVVDTITCLNE